MEKVLKDLEEVKVELQELNRKWVVTDPYPRKRFRQFVVIALIITLIGLTWEHTTITRCFLTPAQTGWSERTCALLYPGYEHARTQSAQNLQRFDQVVNTSLANQQKIDQLEAQLNK